MTVGAVHYGTTWQRVVANTRPNSAAANACWVWVGSNRCRYGYSRMNVYVPGLGRAVKLTAHIVSWLLAQLGETTANDLYLAYQEVRHSKLELDHLCSEPSCVCPDHVEPCTHRENCQRREQRKVGR